MGKVRFLFGCELFLSKVGFFSFRDGICISRAWIFSFKGVGLLFQGCGLFSFKGAGFFFQGCGLFLSTVWVFLLSVRFFSLKGARL